MRRQERWRGTLRRPYDSGSPLPLSVGGRERGRTEVLRRAVLCVEEQRP